MARTPASKLRFMDSTPLTAQERRRAERVAPLRSADDRTVLVGMKRPATPAELRAFIDREQARIRTERGLAPAG
jgi:predicted metal-dependent hydrolase